MPLENGKATLPDTSCVTQPLFSVQEIRQLEQALFADQDSYAVMQAAAAAFCEVILRDYPTPLPHQQVHIVLGSGNNAGDALLVAANLQKVGFSVTAYRVFTSDFQGDAARAYQFAVAEGVPIVPFVPFDCDAQSLLIEGIFGIGFDRPASGVAKAAIEHLNHCKAQNPDACVYAIDLPAGIVADTGEVLGTALIADKTVTFIGDKIGLHTAFGRGCAGEVTVKTLGAEIYVSQLPAPTVWLFHYPTAPRHHFLNSQENTHKGNYGHSLTIGGGQGMFGAAALAAISALKVGTGKSSLFTHDDYANQYHLPQTPLYEVMRCRDLMDLSAYSAVILGTGLGRDAWGQSMFQQALQATTSPLLIDADGLYHLAANLTANVAANSTPAVITPHEAEAAKLLHTNIEAIRRDKLAAVKQLATRYHCIAVLKGSGTLISDGQSVWVNRSGNYYLATAGSGDVLAGVIGGYLAQGFSPLEAARYGVYQHGLAADNYQATHRSKTLRASDLWDYW